MSLSTPKKNKQFVLISLSIFAIITVLSFGFFRTCTSDSCDFSSTTTLNIIIVTFGIIGLVYCFFVLKEFNTIVDKKLEQDVKEILEDKLDLSNNENNKKDDSKLISF